ncbi:hypothetical protein GH714_015494 [Hevea brasiliensis]|uniref:Uncharacterized protein n=1 Tax=Hevea brasiliensis TaxID=3981 RepID=A0A6A6KQ57_HEVBR|nr:hypothetical protein GH714_015494 [Hevea brasiliensis]
MYEQVWILEVSDDGNSNIYPVGIPSITAWLDCPLEGEEKGNFIAVGSWTIQLKYGTSTMNIIASASADRQVKIWDIATRKYDNTLEHHTDKKDEKIPTHPGFEWSVTAGIRAWHGIPTLTLICVSLEDGTVQGFDNWAVKSDSPSDSKPSSTLHAHDKAVCRVSYNPSVPNVGISVFNAISN